MDILKLENEILQQYSASELSEIYRTHLSEFLVEYPIIISDWGLNKQEFIGASIRRNLIAKILAIVISDPNYLQNWLRKIPANLYQSLSIVVWEGQQNISTLETEIDCLLLLSHRRKSGGYFFSMHPTYNIFLVNKEELSSPADKESILIDLPQGVRTALKKQIPPPEDYNLSPVSLEKNINYVFEDKGQILSDFSFFQLILDKESFKTKKRGELTQKSLKEIHELTNLKEFYAGSAELELKSMRIRLLVHLSQIIPPTQLGDSPLTSLKNKYELYKKLANYPHISLLKHVTGWQFVDTELNHKAHLNLCNILEGLPEGEWFDIQQLVRYAKLREINISPLNDDQATRYLRIPLGWDGWGNSNKAINLEKHDLAIKLPAIQMTLFFLAALGILDIAYEQPENEDLHYKDQAYLSTFDGLRMIRLSMLGAYIFGHTISYSEEMPTETQVEITLDERQLLLVMTAPDLQLEYEIGKFARKINRSHYIVDFASFMKNCQSKEDVREKVNWLKKQTGSTIPDNWKVFFNELNARINVLIPKPDLSVFKIGKDSADLMHFLVTDEEISQYIKKAENHHIVISKSDLAKVKDRIRKFGFIL